MAKKPDNTRKLAADKIVLLPLAEIRPYDKNPRKNEKAVQYVKESIRQFGFKVPIVIDSNRVIVCGHTRLLAAKSLGMTEVPCIMADDLTDDQIKAFRLADNKVGEFAEWDMDLLGDELDAIADACDIDMGDFGFDLSGDDEETEIVEDEVPEEVEPVCQRGEVWKLGEHRLMCGDSTMPEDVTKLMAGERADMIFTDPPYGVDIKAVGNKQNRILGDLTQTAIPFSFDTACRFGLKPKAHLYFCGAEKNFAMYDKLFDRYLHNLPRHLIWVKNGFTMKRNGYHNQYEVIYFGYTEGAGDIWYGGRKEEDASDVWRIKKDKASDYVHPTQKPIEIPARAIRNSSPVGGSVLDLFGGSGSTMMACEQLGRKCRMMELDPHYCDVIIARWENLTGQKAVKVEA